MNLPQQPEACSIDQKLQNYIYDMIQDFAHDVIKNGEKTFYKDLYASLAEQLEEEFFKHEEEYE